jgi:hypothetical protein
MWIRDHISVSLMGAVNSGNFVRLLLTLVAFYSLQAI